MSVNRGKQFESVIKSSFEKVQNVSIDRLYDNTSGFKGVAGICDFIVYKKPYEYYIECKSVHGNTLPFSNITTNQWHGLLEKSKIDGVFAGVIVWYIDKDVTRFVPIQFLQQAKEKGFVSLPFNYEKKWILDGYKCLPFDISGQKKRVFFEYDMTTFFKEVENEV